MELSLANVSCILITRCELYPRAELEYLSKLGFGEIILECNCPSVAERFELVKKAKHEHIYVQDDDVEIDVLKLFEFYDGKSITAAMTDHHFNYYKDSQICLIGFGSFFPKALVSNMKMYTQRYGEDEHYQREVDRIFTYLNYPQKRVVFDDLKDWSREMPNRMCREVNHYKSLAEVEEKLKAL